uniref:GNAT family N-acetyltransferase n=1 Tax=candidate division WOR-3 bacterium TaxID=2052148 RepID=A0A7C2PK46_UNCW3
MKKLTELAEREKVNEIFLTVHSNNVNAINLYKKFGFIEIGQLQDKWRESKFSAILMRKNII